MIRVQAENFDIGAELSRMTAGRSVVISTVTADILSTSGEHAPELFDGVEPGDELTVDNRDFIAWCHTQ